MWLPLVHRIALLLCVKRKVERAKIQFNQYQKGISCLFLMKKGFDLLEKCPTEYSYVINSFETLRKEKKNI
jgi:hypothetical protein